MTAARLLAIVTVVVAMAAACTSTHSHQDTVPPLPTPPSYEQLVTAAHLDPCPATSPAKASGKSLPDLVLPCLGSGPSVRLSGLRGTPTVINIWGSWCGPCQAETRYLSQVYDEAKARVRFIGVDTEDDAKSALDFAPHVSPPMHYPQVFDESKKLLLALHLPSAVPTTVFVDASGRVVKISPGPFTSTAKLRADIARYLGVTA